MENSDTFVDSFHSKNILGLKCLRWVKVLVAKGILIDDVIDNNSLEFVSIVSLSKSSKFSLIDVFNSISKQQKLEYKQLVLTKLLLVLFYGYF